MSDLNSNSDEGYQANAKAIWQAGVAAVDTGRRISEFVSINDVGIHFGNHCIRHQDYQNVVILGAGKSASDMAAALERGLMEGLPKPKSFRGRVNVPDDRVVDLTNIQLVGCRPAGINLPTDRVLQATEEMMELIRGCQPDDLVIVLFSGGGSALLERPVPGISLSELLGITKWLSHRGASIEELNAVRSQLSTVKGGRLAQAIPSRHVITLLVSDVLGDPMEAIASGPTVLQDHRSSRAKALAVVRRFSTDNDRPSAAVMAQLHRRDDSPNENARDGSNRVQHFVIANNQLAVGAAARFAREQSYQTESETDFSADRVDVVARRFFERLMQGVASCRQTGQPGCFISGGEPTISIGDNPGLGGRNQHLVLTLLSMVIAETDRLQGVRCSILSGGTDGEDGNVNVAGGCFDSETLSQIQSQESLTAIHRQLYDHLERADSHPLLRRWNALLEVPPTRTNVCDLRVMCWERA